MMMVNGATRSVRQLKVWRDELAAEADSIEANVAERRSEHAAMIASFALECAEDLSLAEEMRSRIESMDLAIATLEKINAH